MKSEIIDIAISINAGSDNKISAKRINEDGEFFIIIEQDGAELFVNIDKVQDLINLLTYLKNFTGEIKLTQ